MHQAQSPDERRLCAGKIRVNAYGLDFHHLGLGVRSPDTAIKFLDDLGYKIGAAIYDPEQNVNLCWCTAVAAPDVEIIWKGKGKSPIDTILSRKDGLIYHICYATDDLPGALSRLEDAGHRAITLGPPKPAILFDGLHVSFYEVVGFGTIEIIDRQPQRP